MEGFVTGVVYVVLAYFILGILVTLWLQFGGGLKKIDPSVEGASVFFRLLISPGLIGLWPVMMAKYFRSGGGGETYGAPEGPVRPSTQRSLHGLAILLLVAALPVIIAAALQSRVPAKLGSSSAAALNIGGDQASVLQRAETVRRVETKLTASDTIQAELQKTESGDLQVKVFPEISGRIANRHPLMVYADFTGGEQAEGPASNKLRALGLIDAVSGAVTYPLNDEGIEINKIRIYIYDPNKGKFLAVGTGEGAEE